MRNSGGGPQNDCRLPNDLARAVRIEREIARRGIIQRGVGAELIGPCPVALRRWGTAESSWMQSLLCGPLRTAARVALFGTVGYLCEVFAVRDDAGTKRQGILVFPEWGAVGECQSCPDLCCGSVTMYRQRALAP